jgi:hypothetical protein
LEFVIFSAAISYLPLQATILVVRANDEVNIAGIRRNLAHHG